MCDREYDEREYDKVVFTNGKEIITGQAVGNAEEDYLARIQMIPKDYYEYASLFGASESAKFRYITWPLLVPTFLFTIVLSVMNAFKCYREAFLLGGNYPHESIYLLQHFMNNNFQNMNYQKISAAAVSIVAVLIIVIVLCYTLYALMRREK